MEVACSVVGGCASLLVVWWGHLVFFGEVSFGSDGVGGEHLSWCSYWSVLEWEDRG